jgi:hypothetical protein
MIQDIRISHLAVFPEGFFEKYPSLLDVYQNNTPRLEKPRIADYEKKITWQHITGPGFCGATHPGAGKCFNRLMTGASIPVFNSDCLYVHAGRRVFAVSDPPGATTISRKLFEELDRRLADDPERRLHDHIHDLALDIHPNTQPTLALIHFPENGASGPDGASVFVAGDTQVFHGNLDEHRLTRIKGTRQFWGTASRHARPRKVALKPDDFFIIASDGIEALRQTNPNCTIEEVLLDLVKTDPRNFAANLAHACNQVYQESFNGTSRTLLTGHDDMTVMILWPTELGKAQNGNAAILGGRLGF